MYLSKIKKYLSEFDNCICCKEQLGADALQTTPHGATVHAVHVLRKPAHNNAIKTAMNRLGEFP